MLYQIVLVIHVLIALSLVGLVLIQHGKGADAGAAFGSGASATVFGAQGSASFLTRLTAGLATVFFVTSVTLASLLGHRDDGQSSVTDTVLPVERHAPTVPEVPLSEIPSAPPPAPAPAAPEDVPLPPE